MRLWIETGVAAALFALGLFLGYQWASGHAAKTIVQELSAEDQRRLAAYDVLTRDKARLTDERDKATAALATVRAATPATLIKTVIKTVEVPAGAREFSCPIVTAGADFHSLWDRAGESYNAMSTASGSDGAAGTARLPTP